MLLRTSISFLQYAFAAAAGLLLLDAMLVIFTVAAVMAGDANVQHISFFDAQIRFLLQ